MITYYKSYHDNGTLAKEYYYEYTDKHKIIGLYAQYYENGSLCKMCNYNIDGKLDGLYTLYYDTTLFIWNPTVNRKQKMSEVTYNNGIKNGLFRSWYLSGELHTEYFCEGDILKGEYRMYYKNGKIKTHKYYPIDQQCQKISILKQCDVYKYIFYVYKQIKDNIYQYVRQMSEYDELPNEIINLISDNLFIKCQKEINKFHYFIDE